MNKEEKENWIIEKFIILYNKEPNNNYKLNHRIPQSISPGPDFIIFNSKQDKKGAEVTELLQYPSENTGQQRYLKKSFQKLLESKIDKDKFKNYYFCFNYFNYPSNQQQLEDHASQIIEQINRTLEKDSDSKIVKIAVGSQIISIRKKDDNGTGPSFMFFMFGEDGAEESDEDNFFKGLRSRIDEKNIASQKYNKEQINILAIYDNTYYSMFINDIKKEISNKLGQIESKEFKEIWLLSGGGDNIFRIDS